jgi:hypothetical protein
MTPATRSRVLQFRAGPSEHRFYACDQHLPDLLDGDMPHFFGRKWDVSEAVDPKDEMPCDWCRGEDGP